MPSANNVQILKESKARFEGVIFKQTADLGTNKATSCQVIDEATGEVIVQSGGGGDTLTEATVTFTGFTSGLSTLATLNPFPLSYEYGSDGETPVYMSNAILSGEHNVILLNGKYQGEVIPEDGDIVSVTATGDIEVTTDTSEETTVYVITITGDGTLTVATT